MKFLKRLKNLWKLSAYRVENSDNEVVIKKDIPTIKSKMAQIIIEKRVDVLEENIETNDNSNK